MVSESIKLLEMTKNLLTAITLVLLTATCTNVQLPAPGTCVEGPVPVVVTITESACGGSTGSILLEDNGLEYAFGNGNFSAQREFTDLGPGEYLLRARDENGCIGELAVSVPVEGGFTVTALVSTSGCESTEGSLSLTASGATGEVRYRLGNSGNFGSSGVFTGLAAGVYTATARDASGCEVKVTREIKTGVSLSEEIFPIIRNNCAVSGCHNGSRNPDLRTNQAIRANANRIQIRTSNETMPPGNRSITQAEINAISCWVEDGAAAN